MALDRRGRVLGYGFGAGDVTNLSVCPWLQALRGARASRSGHHAGGGARPAALQVVRSLKAPGDTVELLCTSRSGTSLFTAGVRYPRASPRGRIRLFRVTRGGPRLIATTPGHTVALTSRAAYVADPAEVSVIGLSDGVARRLAPFPDAGYLAPSPDGTRLAVSAARHGVRLLELPTGHTLSEAGSGQPVWLSPDRLLVRGVGRPRLYDSNLRQQQRLPGFRARGQALVGDLLFGVNKRRLVALDLGRGGRSQVAWLPDPDTFSLRAVPGAPRLRTPRVRPAACAET